MADARALWAFVFGLVLLGSVANAADCTGTTLTDNLTLTEDMTATGSCYEIAAQNITIECAGHTITGDGSGTGIFTTQQNTRILNCNITQFEIGIQLDNGGSNATITNTSSTSENALVTSRSSDLAVVSDSTFIGRSVGIVINDASYCVFYNVTASGDSGAAIALYNDSWVPAYNTFNHLNLTGTSGAYSIFLGSGVGMNTFENSTMISDTNTIYLLRAHDNSFKNLTITSVSNRGIYLDNSSNNTITNSTIISAGVCIRARHGGSENIYIGNNCTSDTWVYDSVGSVLFNDSSSGNIWNLANGSTASEFCNITSTTSTWADGGTDVPFTDMTTCLSEGEWTGTSEDYYPWVGPPPPLPSFPFKLNVFYDVDGYLRYAYYNNISSEMNISQVNGPGVLTPSDPTNGFGAVIRPDVLMSFSSANAVFYNYSSGNLTTTSFPYDIQPNSFYDPYAYAYTKQYSPYSAENLSPDNDSYYLIMANNQTDSLLLKVNMTFGISIINTSSAPAAWQTFAYPNTLHGWFYAFPEACVGSGYNISIFYYNGTDSVRLVTPDPTCYSSGNITNAKVVFEEKDGNVYFIQFNTSSNTTIYRLNDDASYTLNYTMQSISPLLFYDADTFVFYSREAAGTFVYSCYFGNTTTCIRNTLANYGTSAVYTRAPGVTSARFGFVDIVTYGRATSTTPSVVTSFLHNTVDIKLVCNDEVTFTQLPGNFRIYTSAKAAMMSAVPVQTWEYAVSSTPDLGSGTRQIYSICTDGTNRQYFVNSSGFMERAYSLNSSVGVGYSFQITDCHGIMLNGAELTARRYIQALNGSDTVEQTLSQIDGTAWLFLQPNTPYNLTVVSAGRTTFSTIISLSVNGTIPLAMGCSGTDVTTPPVYEAIFTDDLTYCIAPAMSFVTNTSIKANLTAFSKMGRIVSVHWVITKIPTGTANTTYTNSIVFDETRRYNETYNGTPGRFGFNTSYIIPGNLPAIYSIVGTITYINSPINNINGTYNLSSSLFQVTVQTRSSIQIMDFDSALEKVRKSLANGGGAFGGWAWLFVATVCTILAVGYVSRYSTDGAGIIGWIFFTGFALINDATVIMPGFGMISMIQISILTIIMVLATLAWRYV